MLSWLMPRKDSRRKARGLYEAIVAQSRLPVFYRDLGVPDTVTGRFEMLVLHLFLVLERLEGETAGKPVDRAGGASSMGRALNEAFVTDMDDAMREMGVADVRVGQRMHQTAGAFFGRLLAYRKAMAADVAAQAEACHNASVHLTDALARNVFAGENVAGPPGTGTREAGAAAVLANYARRVATRLAETDDTAVDAGRIAWPPVDVVPTDHPATP